MSGLRQLVQVLLLPFLKSELGLRHVSSYERQGACGWSEPLDGVDDPGHMATASRSACCDFEFACMAGATDLVMKDATISVCAMCNCEA